MKNRTRFSQSLLLAGIVGLPLLASCGVRGGLERPAAPIIKSLEPAPAEPVVEKPAPFVEAPRPRINEFGGEIPEAAPTEVVQSAPLESDIESDDN